MTRLRGPSKTKTRPVTRSSAKGVAWASSQRNAVDRFPTISSGKGLTTDPEPTAQLKAMAKRPRTKLVAVWMPIPRF